MLQNRQGKHLIGEYMPLADGFLFNAHHTQRKNITKGPNIPLSKFLQSYSRISNICMNCFSRLQ